MKYYIIIITVLCFNLWGCSEDEPGLQLDTPVLWTGSKIVFTKEDNSDWTMAENQDRLTDSVWITRQNTKPIFNIVKENSFQGSVEKSASPEGTEWAIGELSDGIENLTFNNLGSVFEGNLGESIVDVDLVLHLIAEDIYLDIKFTNWKKGNKGGGFSYERSTPN